MKRGTCKHYTGDYHNTHCAAGVCYADVTTGKDSEPGSAFRKPCINWELFKGERGKVGEMSEFQRREWNRRGTCDKYEEPSKEEIAKYKADMEAHMRKIMVALEFVSKLKEQHSKSWAGIEECPVCKGKLHIKINCFFSEHQGENQKHAHVCCETEGCVKWME